MRILLAAPASEGLVYPLIGIARGLVRLGHEVVFAVGEAFDAVLAAEGFPRVPTSPNEEQAATVKLWAYPPAVAVQAAYIRTAIEQLDVDLVIGHTLALGALAAAEQTGVPIAILGLGIWIWPAVGETGDSPRTRRRARRVTETLRLYDASRAELGMPPCDSTDALLGDRYLLQSAPAFAWREALPDRVHEVGPCLWEPVADDAELAAFLERDADVPLLYAQPARTFGDPGFWGAFVAAMADRRIRVVASIGRLDDVAHAVTPGSFFARANVAQGRVLPAARLVVTTGHSTSFLGAMRAGTPLLVIPHGSGTEDVAELVVERGYGRALDAATLDPAQLAGAVDALLADTATRDRVRAVAGAIDDGCDRAARACVALTRP